MSDYLDAAAERGHLVRVLLVEDHKPLSRALERGLEEESFAVDVAEDGEEADFKAAAPFTMSSCST